MYARVIDGEIIEVGTPTFRPVFFDGRSYDCRDPQVREEYIVAANWLVVTEAVRPEDTATHTSDRDYDMLLGVPVEIWNVRPWTTEELTDQAESANAVLIANKIATVDLPAMQALIDQTNAALRDDPSQELKDIARAVRRLGRKVEGILDGTE